MKLCNILLLCIISMVNARISTPNFFSQMRKGNFVNYPSKDTQYIVKSHRFGSTQHSNKFQLQKLREDMDYRRFKFPKTGKSTISTPNPSTLLKAVKDSGLVVTLSRPRPFPNSVRNKDAFAQISYDTLANVLKAKNVDQLEAILMMNGLPTVILSQDIAEDYK